MTVLRATHFSQAAPEPGTGRLITLRVLLHQAASRIRRVRPEQWWLVLFAILFLGFFLALLFQPAVGRGGR